jgi:hypothetical protein
MLLYRYFPCKILEASDCAYNFDALDTLKQAELKTSRVTDFNDPFEFLPKLKDDYSRLEALESLINLVNNGPVFYEQCKQQDPRIGSKDNFINMIRTDPKYIDEFLDKIKGINEITIREAPGQLDKNGRVVSFSGQKVNPLDEVLMWSHYADGHQGIRMGFEFPTSKTPRFEITKITYCKERVFFDMGSADNYNDQFQKVVTKCIFQKSPAWAYEDEYRLYTTLPNCKERDLAKNGKTCFIEFEREWVKFIDFGVRCEDKNMQLIKAVLKMHYPHTVLRKVKYHKTEYALECS